MVFARRPEPASLVTGRTLSPAEGRGVRRLRSILTTLVALGLLVFLIWQLIDFLRSGPHLRERARGTVTLGIEPFYPYQFEGSDGRLSGMGVELLREAFARAGYRVNLVQKEWSALLKDVEDGRLTAAALAYRDSQREGYGLFSRPYFALRLAVFYRLDRYPRLPASAVELIELAGRDQLRVGRARSYAYPPEIDALHQLSRVVEASNEAQDLDHLINGQVDLVVGDQLAGTSYLMKNRWDSEIGHTTLDLAVQPVHILYSKKLAASELVERVDEAIDSMSLDGTTSSIVRGYHYPILLSLLEHNFRFDEISVLAAAVAAVSGIFLARKEGYNLVGAFLLAAAPAAGGGLLRDLIAGRHPVAVVAHPSILITVLAMVLSGFLLFRLLASFSPSRAAALKELNVDSHPLLIFCDALGLASFTVIGVVVAMQYHCEPLWLWGPLLAAATNGGGSLIRDIIRHQPNKSLRTTELYVELSLFWGMLLSAYLTIYSGSPPHQVAHLQLALLGTMVGVVVTRLVAYRLKWRGPGY